MTIVPAGQAWWRKFVESVSRAFWGAAASGIRPSSTPQPRNPTSVDLHNDIGGVISKRTSTSWDAGMSRYRIHKGR